MDLITTAIAGTAGAIGLGVGGKAVYDWIRATRSFENVSAVAPREAGRVIPVAPRIPVFASLDRQWQPLPSNPESRGFRLVPIKDMANTYPAGGWENYGVRATSTDSHIITKSESCIALLNAIKYYLRNNGYDWDARCVFVHWVHECGFKMRACWNRAATNIKAKWRIYATPDLVRSGKVYTSHQWADGVHILQGVSERSLEAYFSYPSFEAELKFENYLFNNGRYRGVIDGYRRGDLAGCIAANRIMGTTAGNPGWSYATPDERERMVRNTWAVGLSRAGDRWVR